MRNVRCHDRRSRVGAVLVLGLLCLPVLPAWSSAQGPAPDSGAASPHTAARTDGEVVKPGGGVSRGVIVPKAGVDPGMKVKAPRMPMQSMPVIRPQLATPGGSPVVVPK